MWVDEQFRGHPQSGIPPSKKKKKTNQNADTCKNIDFFFRYIMLSERSQTQKVTFFMSVFIGFSGNRATENRSRLPEPVSRGRID